MHAVVYGSVSHEVGNSRGQPFYDRVLPIAPPATDKLILSGERQELQNIPWIELEIAVERRHELSSGLLESGVEGRGLPIIPIEVKHTDFSMIASELIEELRTAIGAAVIHINDLE